MMRFFMAVCLFVSGPVFGADKDSAKSKKAEPAEPALVITPNTIRIQSLTVPNKGYWVVMPGFSELGSPCFSPDGEWIAFDAYKGGFNHSPSEAWIARRNVKNLTRLASGATPRWSPDGKSLVFMRDAPPPALRTDIFVIQRDGTGETKIGEGRWPDWSPDGKEITFSAGGIPKGGSRVGSTVWISKADGSGRREVGPGDCPSWSPDGTKLSLCYQAAESPPIMVAIDLKSKKGTVLGIGFFRGNWTADSRAVVCNGVIGRELKMVKLTPDKPGSPTELISEFVEARSPSCSFDGKDVVYIAKRPKVELRP